MPEAYTYVACQYCSKEIVLVCYDQIHIKSAKGLSVVMKRSLAKLRRNACGPESLSVYRPPYVHCFMVAWTRVVLCVCERFWLIDAFIQNVRVYKIYMWLDMHYMYIRLYSTVF